MTFEYEGDKYRIGFEDGRSRAWGAHANHAICFYARGMELYCATCKLKLARFSPDLAQVLRTKHPFVTKELRRTVKCGVYVRKEDGGLPGIPGSRWVLMLTGEGRPSKGDGYQREEGRRAALEDALRGGGKEFDALRMGSPGRPFNEAAWAAYLGRQRAAAARPVG